MSNQAKYDIELLYRQYYNDVYRFIMLICSNILDAEDIAQNTFLQAMKGLGNFRDECSIKTWLFTIARNETIKYAKKARTQAVAADPAHRIDAVYIDDAICRSDKIMLIIDYIQACEEPKRSLLALRLLQEKPYAEIEKIVNKSPTWCRVTFMRAKNELIKKLEGSS